MSGIFGLIHHTGKPVSQREIAAMVEALWQAVPSDATTWADKAAALGQIIRPLAFTLGLATRPRFVQSAGIAFTAVGRLDNRNALVAELALDRTASSCGVTDADVMLGAYRRWGEDAPSHLLGDWTFAVWDPVKEQLFVVRDQTGNASLYYACNATTFAFAPTEAALTALGLGGSGIDEIYLAQVLTSWWTYRDRTMHPQIKRLLPAHALTSTADSVTVRRYWRMEDVAPQRLPRRIDYAVALRELFDEAVRTRLRGAGRVAILLSGGLDSGAVAVTAAAVRENGTKLMGFTSVPATDPSPYVHDGRLGNELPYTTETARAAGVDLVASDSRGVTPVQGMRWLARTYRDPRYAGVHGYWLFDLLTAARRAACGVLLMGSDGNYTISWAGRPTSQPWRYQLRRLGLSRWIRGCVGAVLPDSVRRVRMRRALASDWYRSSPIRPELVRRLALTELRLADPGEMPSRCPITSRIRLLNFTPGVLGRIGFPFGLDIRDPTADRRIIEFTLSVPDSVFIDHETGTERWLVREAMRGRLPDKVRLNRLRGLQAADVVPRLRNSAAEVDDVLNELENGASAAYVDVPYMRDVWRYVRTEDTPDARSKAELILCRGITCGLVVNEVARGRPALQY